MNDIEILIPEFDKNPKGFLWYLIAFTISAGFGLTAYLLNNYTFIAIILLFWMVVITKEIKRPTLLSLVIDSQGIKLGSKFWGYNNLKDFSIFPVGDKDYLIFTPIGKYQLSVKIPIKRTEEIRAKLINFLTQVEYQEPFIDGLARILRI